MKFELNEYHRNIEPEELIKDLRRVAVSLDKEYISRQDYEKNGKFSATPFIRNFGSWKAALKMANMCTERSPKDYKRISDDELINDVKRIAIKLDKNSISSTEYNNNGKY